MRVITGSARGRKLTTLEGMDIVRPTADSVKEAMFSIIQFELENRRVLDLFAGCGQLGIEAISRGAKHCTFVEKNKQALAVLKENVKNCKMTDNADIINTDAISFLGGVGLYDIAILDPPYNKDLINTALPMLTGHMSGNGLIICESEIGEELLQECNLWKIIKIYKYGKTKLTVYRKVAD